MSQLSQNAVKCLLISIAFCISTNHLLAQDTTTQLDENLGMRNEVKLNLAYASFGYFEGSYERLLNNKSSLGLVAGKSIERYIDLNYHFMAYFRVFFGQQIKASGFFIEANTAYWNDESEWFAKRASKGIGLAIGAKFFRGNKLHGEFLFGLGKTLVDNSFFFEETYPRLAISIGHRF